MRTDIRSKTGLIIRKDGEYLVGTICYSTDLRWSISPWDAWITRDMEKARKVADRVGGEIMLFNPVAGQIRKIKAETQPFSIPPRFKGGSTTVQGGFNPGSTGKGERRSEMPMQGMRGPEAGMPRIL